MKRTTAFFCCLLWVFTFLNAQTQPKAIHVAVGNGTQMLSIDSLMNGNLYPQRIYGLQFIPKTDKFVYVKDSLLLQLDKSGKTSKLISLSELNQVLKNANEQAVRMIPAIRFTSPDAFTFYNGSSLYSYNLKEKKIKVETTLDKAIANIAFEPNNGNKAAYTKSNGLYVMSNGIEKEIAIDKNPDIVFGQRVHQNEFNIDKGIFWSPKSNLIAFYRMDQSMVTDYPLVNTKTRTATEKPIKYPMAGMKSHHVTLGVYNMATEKTIYLKTQKDTSIAELESYLTNITWSPDEKSIYIQKLNRKQNHLKLECYDVVTGNLTTTLLEEKSDKYVEPLNPLYFIPNNNNEFLYLSQKDGFMHIYLYNTSGKELKQLTQGAWIVKNVVGFNEKGTHCYFYATKESPLEIHFYSVELKSGKIEKITQQAGTHTVLMNTEGTLFLDSYSSASVPFQIDLLDNSGKTLQTIHKSANPLAEFIPTNVDIFTIKAADKTTDLYCRMIKPANFNPQKKYPVITYVYGGPHAQMITDSWMCSATSFLYYLAQQGYIIWTVDSRGSANRGFEFESVIAHNLGVNECADQMEGIKYLKSLPYVDSTRIGVDGWSYGGFMTISLKLKYPNVFKVATAGGPVVDWKWYEIMYGERYAGSPQDYEAGYKSSSLINQAQNLEGKLLVMHGAQDNVVVWQHSLEFIDACIKNGKLVDYFVYPTQPHNVLGKERVHLFKKIFDYYQQNL